MTTINRKTLIEKINAIPARGAWFSGVKKTAVEIVESVDDNRESWQVENFDDLKKILLRGAETWIQYARGACGSIVSDCDICNRFCSPSEVKKYREGNRRPPLGDWMDVYATALRAGENMIRCIYMDL